MANFVKAFLILVITAFFLCLYNPAPDIEAGMCPISTVPGNVQYYFEWDPNNPNTIGRGGQQTLRVVGGKAPFSWSVSGRGFSLAESQTDGPSNTLSANNSACGSAWITAHDSLGTVRGSVRVPDHGFWFFKGHYCGLSGKGPNRGGTIEYIRGGQKQMQYTYNLCECGLQAKTEAECDAYINANCPSLPNCINGNKWAGGPGPCIDAWWLPHSNAPPTPDCNSRVAFSVKSLDYYEFECGY